MKQARDDVFSGAAFARNQDREVGAADSLQLLAHLAHGSSLPKDDRLRRQWLRS